VICKNRSSPEARRQRLLSQSAEVLCQIAQLFKMPLTLSVVPENKNAPRLIASLHGFALENNQFLRATASPFIDPATREHLASLRRPTLIIAGFATEVVVLHAALDALRKGYGVIVAVDACGGMSDRTESAALAHSLSSRQRTRTVAIPTSKSRSMGPGASRSTLIQPVQSTRI
jgi:hypothetical protein